MKRLIPFVLLILLLLAGIFAIPFLLRPESHRTEITNALTKLLKRPVVIGAISMSYWPPTLHVGKMVVMKEDGNPALQIESADAPLDVSALFHLQFLATGLQLNHWVLTTLRKADGSWDVQDWLSSSTTSSNGKTWPIQEITWKGGELHAVDPFASAPQEVVIGTMDGRLSLKQGAIMTTGVFTGLGSPAKLSFNATGQFFSQPKWSGDFQLTDQANSCTLHVDKQAGVTDIKGGSPHWALANALIFIKFYSRATAGDSSSALTLDNWQLHAHGDLGHLTFEQSAGISGGLSEVKGRVDAQASGRLAHFDVALKDIPVEAVLGVAGENIPLSGKVTAVGKDFELLLSSRTSNTFKGQGYFELKDGRYKLPDISVKKLAKAKTMPYLKKKYPDFEQNGIPVTKLTAHWQAKDGKVSIDDGFFMSMDIQAAWTGNIDIPRQGLDGTLRLQLHEKDPKLSSSIPVKYRTQPAYGRLQGTWQEWFLRAVASSKIPAATQSKLRKTINQK